MRFFALFFLLGCGLAGCANHSIDDIPASDAGQVFKTRFGTVVSQHSVSIRTSPQTAISVGVLSAGMAGTLAAADHATFVGGALAGGSAAALLHYFGETDNAIEYQIMLENGNLVLIDQVQRSSERVFQPGETVVVQFGALNSRVLAMPEGPLLVKKLRRLVLEGAKGGAEKPPKKLDVKVCDKAGLGNSIRETCQNY